jgi:hypothetical protein
MPLHASKAPVVAGEFQSPFTRGASGQFSRPALEQEMQSLAGTDSGQTISLKVKSCAVFFEKLANCTVPLASLNGPLPLMNVLECTRLKSPPEMYQSRSYR